MLLYAFVCTHRVLAFLLHSSGHPRQHRWVKANKASNGHREASVHLRQSEKGSGGHDEKKMENVKVRKSIFSQYLKRKICLKRGSQKMKEEVEEKV